MKKIAAIIFTYVSVFSIACQTDARPKKVTRLEQYLSTVTAKVPGWYTSSEKTSALGDTVKALLPAAIADQQILDDFPLTLEYITTSAFISPQKIVAKFVPAEDELKRTYHMDIAAVVDSSARSFLVEKKTFRIVKTSFRQFLGRDFSRYIYSAHTPVVAIEANRGDSSIKEYNLGIMLLDVDKIEPYDK